MASLLVSVRSASEARSALEGGAAVIDVKEPDRGPLGRADEAVWAEVRRAVPSGTPISVALGELREWDHGAASGSGVVGRSPAHDPASFKGFAFRKLGLAGAGSRWESSWATVREQLGNGPSWVAVLYADWERADAPHPDHVLDVALACDDCAGVLIDTWDKSAPSPIGPHCAPWLERARAAGRLTALAGSLDAEAIRRLAPALRPDIIAVRSAACLNGDRFGPVDAGRVAQLARVAAGV